jgi:hypothetical protein
MARETPIVVANELDIPKPLARPAKRSDNRD